MLWSEASQRTPLIGCIRTPGAALMAHQRPSGVGLVRGGAVLAGWRGCAAPAPW